jgi:S-methylmethionine-dependent homocysteine/selenocysteine methylase
MPDKPAVKRAYQRIERMLADGGPVLLDGGIGSELERAGYDAGRNTAEAWGTRALDEAPDLTREVHRRYVEAGADVITTNTWRLDRYASGGAVPEHADGWPALAVRAVDLAREATQAVAEPPAIAFSLFTEPLEPSSVAPIAEAVVQAQPDLVLVETTESIPEDLRFPAFETLLSTEIPLWVSYRWTLDGPCDVSDLGITPIHGRLQTATGDLFGRAAAELERLGVSALLVNCLPPERVRGTLPFLRGYTDLPLGVYPNAGRFIDPGWDFEHASSPEAFAIQAGEWLADGATIVGGCCGVGPEHISAARRALAAESAR